MTRQKELDDAVLSIRIVCSDLGDEFGLQLPVKKLEHLSVWKLVELLAGNGLRGSYFELAKQQELQAFERDVFRREELRKDQQEFYQQVEKTCSELIATVQQLKSDYWREIDHLRIQLDRQSNVRDFEPDDVVFFDPRRHQLPSWPDIVERLDGLKMRRELLKKQMEEGQKSAKVKYVAVHMLCCRCRSKFSNPDDDEEERKEQGVQTEEQEPVEDDHPNRADSSFEIDNNQHDATSSGISSKVLVSDDIDRQEAHTEQTSLAEAGRSYSNRPDVRRGRSSTSIPVAECPAWAAFSMFASEPSEKPSAKLSEKHSEKPREGNPQESQAAAVINEGASKHDTVTSQMQHSDTMTEYPDPAPCQNRQEKLFISEPNLHGNLTNCMPENSPELSTETCGVNATSTSGQEQIKDGGRMPGNLSKSQAKHKGGSSIDENKEAALHIARVLKRISEKRIYKGSSADQQRKHGFRIWKKQVSTSTRKTVAARMLARQSQAVVEYSQRMALSRLKDNRISKMPSSSRNNTTTRSSTQDRASDQHTHNEFSPPPVASQPGLRPAAHKCRASLPTAAAAVPNRIVLGGNTELVPSQRSTAVGHPKFSPGRSHPTASGRSSPNVSHGNRVGHVSTDISQWLATRGIHVEDALKKPDCVPASSSSLLPPDTCGHFSSLVPLEGAKSSGTSQRVGALSCAACADAALPHIDAPFRGRQLNVAGTQTRPRRAKASMERSFSRQPEELASKMSARPSCSPQPRTK